MRRACFFAYMRSNDIGLVICGALLTALTFTRAWPQQAQPPGDSFTQHTFHQPYSVETFGEFRRMMLTGDFTSKVQLNAAMAKRPTVGIGAVAGARGEISIFDGKLAVSYGKTGPSTDASLEYAALLVIALAADWR